VDQGAAEAAGEGGPGVVLACDRSSGVAELGCARAAALPLLIVHAQAMHQQQDARARLRDRCRQRCFREFERPAGMTQRHRGCQRIAAAREVIAQHAIEGRQHRFALR
jgi:hypothetical protein